MLPDVGKSFFSWSSRSSFLNERAKRGLGYLIWNGADCFPHKIAPIYVVISPWIIVLVLWNTCDSPILRLPWGWLRSFPSITCLEMRGNNPHGFVLRRVSLFESLEFTANRWKSRPRKLNVAVVETPNLLCWKYLQSSKMKTFLSILVGGKWFSQEIWNPVPRMGKPLIRSLQQMAWHICYCCRCNMETKSPLDLNTSVTHWPNYPLLYREMKLKSTMTFTITGDWGGKCFIVGSHVLCRLTPSLPDNFDPPDWLVYLGPKGELAKYK